MTRPPRTSHRQSGLPRTLACRLATAAMALVLLPAPAQEPAGTPTRNAPAHVHGKVELAIAIDGPAVTIRMASPLDNLLGFERVPRTDVEKNAVEQLVARLRAADHLFRIDPAAGCKLGPVQIESAVLGLGKEPAGKDEHADLHASLAFNCARAAGARFIETDLFQAFPGVRQIEAAITVPDGQFRRSLKRPAQRIGWDR